VETRQVELNAILEKSSVIPVLVIENVDDALPLAEALIRGGIRVLEITLRSQAAWSAAETIAHEIEEAVVGVGTVTHAGQMKRAADLDLAFAVSPGLTPTLLKAAVDTNMPFLPGVATVSEAMTADDLGFSTLKFFPAVPAGGIPMLKAVAGPLPHLRFCPTGGINKSNVSEFLGLKNVVCVGGSWVAPKNLIRAKDWDGITDLANEAVTLLV